MTSPKSRSLSSRPRDGHALSQLARLAAVVALTGMVGLVASTAGADGLPAVDQAADATEPADRGSATQAIPVPGPPSYGGCLVGTVSTVSSSVDPQRRWTVGTKSSSWKSALYPVAGVKGPVVVVGDSLTVGAMDTTMRNLVDAGYGPVCIDGAVSRRVNVSGDVTSGLQVIARIKGSDPVWQMPVVRWTIALGTNDVRAATSYNAVYSSLITMTRNAIGPVTVTMYWLNVRTDRPTWKSFENEFNVRIPAAGTVVIDWAAFVDGPPVKSELFAGDDVHLNGSGYTQRGGLTANTIIATT